MMLMGGALVLLLILLPIALIGIVFAFALGLLGRSPDITSVLGLPRSSDLSDDPATRFCDQCGQPLKRGWAFCPGCGVEVHWV